MKIWHFLLICLLSGCYTANKAKKDIIKAKLNYPDVVSAKFSEWYKCDTVTVVKDSIQFKEWIKEIKSFDTIKETDTVLLRLKCPQALIKYRDIIKRVPAIHDTIKIIDRLEVESTKSKYENLRNEHEGNLKLMNKISLFALLLLLIIFLIAILKK